MEPPLRLVPEMLEGLRLPALALAGDSLPTLRVTVGGNTFLFHVEYRRTGTPQQIEQARVKAEQAARRAQISPLVVVPHLSEERLLALEQEGASALDLCGNAVLVVPGSLYVLRTGFPNRFQSGAPLKNVFQGYSSLVARVFLLRREFDRVGQIGEEIRARGGALSPGTVSKALKELEGQLLVGRESGRIRLLDPERLLERLEQEYDPPKPTNIVLGRSDATFDWLRERGVPVVRTGIGSATRYASLSMEDTLRVYTPSLDRLLAGAEVTPTNRFPTLEVRETEDPTAYFDARDGFASPLQTYLEMRASGDERLRQSAAQVRQKILNP